MKRETLLRNTYAFTFFLGLHGFLFLYINSSILEQFVAQQYIGLLFAVGSLLTIPALVFLPKILRRFGDVRITLATLILEGTALFYLVNSTDVIIVIVAFFAHTILLRILLLDADVFLESASRTLTTGKIRGIFLTIVNVALVISPLLVGFLLKGSDTYTSVFFVALCALLIAFLILLFSFKHFTDPKYTHMTVLPIVRTMLRTPDLRGIFVLNMVLRTFYAVMVIYTGLYLHTTLGLPWDTIGLIFTIMLLPFVLIELPLGYLADTRWGEKEVLIVGLCITGLSTMTLSWITSVSIAVWGVALFITRIGASAIEIMTETYFFKHTRGADVEMMSLYRIVEPVMYVIAPTLASVFLIFFDIRYVFLALGGVVLMGLIPAWSIRDTK